MRIFLFAFCFLLALARPVVAGPTDRAGVEFFEKKIRPVLVEHCYKCHSAEAKKQRGGLALDSRAGVLEGGDSGPALVPGKPDQSLLLKAIRHADGSLKMPPESRLPDPIVADFRAWIARGAPDPRARAAVPSAAASWEKALRERRTWWSLRPVKKPTPPAVKDAGWSADPVDRFLLARLEQAGLKAAAPADRRTLVRRLSLVLTGLPPTPAEVDTFLHAASPLASQRLVDRLLASPHFGERWARHWLDVVRFAETHGNEWNYEVHHAWRYRDYLTRALNQDVPYDQFVREHIAGDLLPEPRWDRAARCNESVIGTAFYRFGEVNHDDCVEFRQIGFDLVDNQIDTLTKAFQATTVACARCHDHKLDAVSMKDYYGLLGILRSSRLVSHTLDAPEVNAEPRRLLRGLKTEIRKELAGLWRREAGLVGAALHAAQAALDGRPGAAELARGSDPNRVAAWKALLKAGKAPLEDPLHAWLALRGKEGAALQAAWQRLAAYYDTEGRARADFNGKNFVAFGDFRPGLPQNWQTTGQGLRGGGSGDFAVAAEGDAAVSGVLPAGAFTHTLSDRLNGVLRSPTLSAGKKYLSFHVLGGKTSAVRLVSNNCQLNYINYRALTRNEWEWKKFTVPPGSEALRTYAELLTKFDNPKFPDQLGTLGGDTANVRVPWEQAAVDPRSFFGITRAVLHDCEESPRAELGHLRPLVAAAPRAEADLAARYGATTAAALDAWADGRATDDHVRWLDWLVKRGLLTNSRKATPRLEQLVARYRAVEQQLAQPRIVPGVADGDTGFDQPVFARGDHNKPGEAVPRRYLEVLDTPQGHFATRGSGRLELARRIASPDNPLTARVLVNRVWHHLFGTGIVRTVDDFGHVGEAPSHPELLDFLAARFVEEGWSVKRLIRALVLTRTFQMSSRATAAGQAVDPDNRLLHHYPARRVEAEVVRDSVLAASGRLNRRLFGPSVHPFRAKANADRRLFPGPLDGDGRRSLYIKVNLMEGPPFLGAFDFPGGKVTRGRRDVTNVPAQALALLNDPFVLQQADFWASGLVTRHDASVAARVEHVFRSALGRPPAQDERERFERAVGRLAELHGVPADSVLGSRAVWKDVAHALFNLKEFIYIP